MAFDRRRSGGNRGHEDSRRRNDSGRGAGRRGGSFFKKGRRDNDENQKRDYPEYTGTVQMTRDGFVFVKVEELEDDVYVRQGKTKGALNGDTVKVAVTKEKTETRKQEGVILEITERSRKPFVGVLHVVGHQAWVLMQSRVMPYDISIDITDLGGKPIHRRGSAVPESGYLKELGGGEFAVAGVTEMVDGKAQELKVRSGLKVAALVDSWDRGEPNPKGHLVDVLGEPGENDTEMHSILAEYGLPYRFEPDVENAADSISDKITAEDLKGRRDFRDTLTFTIDPEDAKDFDDALSFKKLENGNYEVGVHIADVSYYVTPGSVVDKEAQARGTSVYLVDRTVPMLPEKLSNKLCSLRPNEEKLTFSAVFELTPLAGVVGHWFGRTFIKFDYRFAYETAQQIIDNGEKSLEMDLRGGTDGIHSVVKDPILEASPEAAERRAREANAEVPAPENDIEVPSGDSFAEFKAAGRSEAMMGAGVYEGCVIPRELKEAILTLHKIASILRKRRFAAGAISFDRPEMKVEVDEKGRPIRVYQKISKEANWLIEEFMLLANRSVAEFIATGGKMNGVAKKTAKTFVYRIHDVPNPEKVAGLREFAGNFGYHMDDAEDGKKLAKALNGLLTEAKDKPEFSAIEILALRSMAKACYSTDNIGHYGLGFKFYTHFTSPIRRYPDTMVHRLLQLYLDGADSQSKAYYEDQCKHASEREVIAAEAERSSTKYKLVEFMQDKVGGEYDGHISGLTEWGMYVEIEPTKIEGMVALRDIQSDFFEFDQDHYRIIGKRTGVIYNLGDPVKIRVKATNLEQKLLDYELVETGNEDRVSHHEDIPGQYEERRPAAKVFDRTTRKRDSDRQGAGAGDRRGGRFSDRSGDDSPRRSRFQDGDASRRGGRFADGEDSPKPSLGEGRPERRSGYSRRDEDGAPRSRRPFGDDSRAPRGRRDDRRPFAGRSSRPSDDNAWQDKPFSEKSGEVERPFVAAPEVPMSPESEVNAGGHGAGEVPVEASVKAKAVKPAPGEGDKVARKAKVQQAIKLSKAKNAKAAKSSKSARATKAEKTEKPERPHSAGKVAGKPSRPAVRKSRKKSE